jgi:hypothetical protein
MLTHYLCKQSRTAELECRASGHPAVMQPAMADFEGWILRVAAFGRAGVLL